MTTHPGEPPTLVLLGLIALALLATALLLLRAAFRPRRMVVRRDPRDSNGLDTPRTQLVADPRDGRRKALLLAVAAALLLWVFAGRFVVSAFHPTGAAAPDLGARHDEQAARRERRGTGRDALRPGRRAGAGLHPRLGRRPARLGLCDRRAARALPRRRLGPAGPAANRRPSPDGDYSMSKMAGDLDSVVSSMQGRPVILVGHSIGGMLNIEYARRFPAKLGREVTGLVQANTTYTNPVETKKGAELSRKLQKPVYEPLLEVITLDLAGGARARLAGLPERPRAPAAGQAVVRRRRELGAARPDGPLCLPLVAGRDRAGRAGHAALGRLGRAADHRRADADHLGRRGRRPRCRRPATACSATSRPPPAWR